MKSLLFTEKNWEFHSVVYDINSHEIVSSVLFIFLFFRRIVNLRVILVKFDILLFLFLIFFFTFVKKYHILIRYEYNLWKLGKYNSFADKVS